jgi:hypothetical protein
MDDDELEMTWQLALYQLEQHQNPRPLAELFQNEVPLPKTISRNIGHLLDPDFPSNMRSGQLLFVRSGKFSQMIDSFSARVKAGQMVLEAEAIGEKRYLAVEQVAKRIGKTPRYLWSARKLAESIRRRILHGK